MSTSTMTSTLPVIDVARAVSTLAAGVTTGMMLSYPFVYKPAIYTTKSLSSHDRLRLWSKGYDRGAATIPPTVMLSAAGFLLAAYLVPASATIGTTGLSRRLALSVFGLSAGAVIPFTGVVMMQGIKTLKTHEKEADVKPEVVEPDTAGLIESWFSLHNVRIVLMGTAFVGGVLELMVR